MKFVISTQELNYLIGKLLNVIPQKPAVPILSNILIEARNGELILTATDLTVGIRCFTEAKILAEGATTLPAKRFAQLVRELTAVNVEITTNQNEVTDIVAGSSKFKMHGMNTSEYPSLPDMRDAQQLRFSEAELKEMFLRTSFAVSREDNRYVLTGVYLNVEDGNATFIGTDGKRLARTFKTIPGESPANGSYIVPLKAVEEITKNLSNEDNEATIFLMDDKIAVQSSDSIIVSKLLTGEYPDVNRVIPDQPDTIVSLHREELTSLLKQISLFTAQTTHSVRFTFTDGELMLTANTMDVGEGVVKMPVNYHGDKFEIAFNPNYFLDILRHGKSETVKMGLIDAFNPGVITDEDQEPVVASGPSPLYVLMPMRLGEE
ncbi:MAG: DNA polymerase III subunit beta [Chlamydiota bacterium]|nr:DNA polymerase III subunit beta [Chlamydiota bacterium]